MTELAEALDAQTVARGLPTAANTDHAITETKQAAAICHLFVAAQSRSA